MFSVYSPFYQIHKVALIIIIIIITIIITPKGKLHDEEHHILYLLHNISKSDYIQKVGIDRSYN